MKNSFEKVYYFQGVDAEGSYKRLGNSLIISPETLSNYTCVEVIGKPTKGFNHKKLDKFFSSVRFLNLPYINLIFDVHGGIDSTNNNYVVATKGKVIKENYLKVEEKINELILNLELSGFDETLKSKILDNCRKELMKVKYEFTKVTPGEIIEKINELTGGIPLKIISTSCLGYYWHNYLNLLPKGSILITLSDKDSPTSCHDMANKNNKKILDELFKDSFNLEKLMEAYCLSQAQYQNTPVIGFVDSKGLTHKLSLSDYCQKRFQKESNLSKGLITYLQESNLSLEYITSLIKKITSTNSINDLKFNPLLYREIISPSAEIEALEEELADNQMDSEALNLESSGVSMDALMEIKNKTSSLVSRIEELESSRPSISLLKKDFYSPAFADVELTFKKLSNPQFILKTYFKHLKTALRLESLISKSDQTADSVNQALLSSAQELIKNTMKALEQQDQLLANLTLLGLSDQAFEKANENGMPFQTNYNLLLAIGSDMLANEGSTIGQLANYVDEV